MHKTEAGEKRRQEILNFLRQYWRENNFAPSRREIIQACKISSLAVLDYHLRVMEELGMIRPIKYYQARQIAPADLKIKFEEEI